MTTVYVESALLFRNVDVAMLVVGENVGFQSKFFVRVRFEVYEQIAVRFASSVDIRLYHMFRVTRVHLSRQMYPSNTKHMIESYVDATSEPYSYLFVDLKPNTDEKFRLKADIFPDDEHSYVYVPK